MGRASHSESSRAPQPAPPPEAWAPLVRVVSVAKRPLERFLHLEAASGVVLMLTAAFALFWANSPWGGSYAALWHAPVGISLGSFSFERSLEWVINDGLMVIFFFVVGMEIRREVHDGELSDWRRASLPAAAALGGMLAPAALYLWLAGSGEARRGWGVPMATDIAFAAGILTLLGKRVPAALRVLLLALAVIDDLGAIIVIAVFYSTGLDVNGLLLALAGLGVTFIMQRAGVRHPLLYVAPAIVAWAGVYQAGVHPTIAGVIVGLMTPVRAWPEGHESTSPAERLIEKLHPWVAFVIMPLFALANAGVVIQAGALGGATLSISLGILVGLVVGKPLGVLLACALMLRLKLARLPAGIGARQLLVLGCVAGVGFTMSLFVAQLAFVSAELLAAAKLAVLVASGVAGVLSLVVGYLALPRDAGSHSVATADEAEARAAVS